jgi:hypothetical protein
MALINNRYNAIIDGTVKPWEVEKSWQDGKILPERGMARYGVIFAVLWLLLVAGLATTFVVRFDDPLLGVFSLLFVGPGVFLLVRFVPQTLRERRYSGVYLQPSRIPSSPGERFEAVLYTGADQAESVAPVALEVRLTCNRLVQRSTTGENTGPRYARHIIREETFPITATVGAGPEGPVLTGRISVDLPGNLPETSRLPGKQEMYDWRMDVTSPADLQDFHYEFRLPVYDTRSALERADEALGAAGLADPQATPEGPVPKEDLAALAAYRSSVRDTRRDADRRTVLKRFFRILQPHTTIQRQGDIAFSFVHVRGDRPVRLMRRAGAVLLFGAAVVIAGPVTPVLLLAVLVLLFMAKGARPVAIAVHADSMGLQVDIADGRKKKSRRYQWDEVGMIADTKFSVFYYDVMVSRPKRRRATLGARLPSQQDARGIAAAIAAVRDRYGR